MYEHNRPSKKLINYNKLSNQSILEVGENTIYQVFKIQSFFRIYKKETKQAPVKLSTTAKRNAFFNSRQKKNDEYGWKVHVSINPTDKNMNKALQVMTWFAAKHDLKMFKIVIPNKKSSTPGKEITIPLFKSPHISNWHSLLSELEFVFRAAEIDPNPKSVKTPPTSDRKIDGSRYLHYRNDSTPKGGYIEANKAKNYGKKSYNPFEMYDPLLKLTMTEEKEQGKTFSW